MVYLATFVYFVLFQTLRIYLTMMISAELHSNAALMLLNVVCLNNWLMLSILTDLEVNISNFYISCTMLKRNRKCIIILWDDQETFWNGSVENVSQKENLNVLDFEHWCACFMVNFRWLIYYYLSIISLVVKKSTWP